MTTQRDRLATVLADVYFLPKDAEAIADALLPRGIRVVDTEVVGRLPEYSDSDLAARIEARIAATGKSNTAIARDKVIAIVREEAAR